MRGLLFSLAFLALLQPPASALDLQNVLTDYTISSWSQRDGLPPGTIWAIAQDQEGYLWVGMDAGLFRFDGVRFTPWEALSSSALHGVPVRSLTVARDGSLWVGFDERGGVSRIRGRQARNFGDDAGLPRATVRALVEDSRGIVWAGNEMGVFEFDGERWLKLPAESGLPASAVYSLYVDRGGHFFVGTATGIFRRAAGDKRFEQLASLDLELTLPVSEDVSSRPRSLSEGPLGGIYVTDRLLGLHEITRPEMPVSSERGRGYRLLFDRRNSLWVATLGQGLWRLRRAPSTQAIHVERATSTTGLLSDEVISLTEDVEGNIWAGTREGLNRLTPRKFRQLTNLGLVVGIESTDDGHVWIGSVHEVSRFSLGTPDLVPVRITLGAASLRSMHRDERGRIWFGTDRGLARLERGRSSPLPVPGSDGLTQVELMTSDFDGGLWIYDLKRGLLRWGGARFEPFDLPHASASTQLSVLYTDRRGRVWLGFDDGRVGIIDAQRRLQLFGPQDGLLAGACRQIHEDGSGVVWLAAADGLSRFVEGRFDTVRSRADFRITNLTALTDDDEDNLWIGQSSGIVRLAKSEYVKAIASPSHKIQYSLYTRADGLGGLPIRYSSGRHVVRAADGQLWFLTSPGVTLIDPKAFNDARDVPPARIEYAVVDNERLLTSAGTTLPPGVSRLEIVYTALNLTSPLSTRFRYRLEGFDPDWVDAGTRQQATYTSLPPQEYRFHVASGTDDGWSDRGAVWTFAIRPSFYQTGWFYSAIVLAGLAAGWGLWQVRMRQVQGRFSLLLDERARLSRELHDTLLQSLVGMDLQLDAIAAVAASESPTIHKQLVRMRRQVDEYVTEARQSIWELRSPRLEKRDLSTALRELGEDAVSEHPIIFEFELAGRPRSLGSRVEDQLLRIGQEAVTNSVRHSRATRITMKLQYDQDAAVLTVADDGCGFDPAAVAVGPAGSHYGLLSMKERALQAGGELQVVSAAGQGTEVRVGFTDAPARRGHSNS